MSQPRRFGKLLLKFALVTLALVMVTVLSMAAILLLDQKTTREEDMRRRWVEIAGIVQVSLSNAVTNCDLCRIRHKSHYAESRIMPSRGWFRSRAGSAHAA